MKSNFPFEVGNTIEIGAGFKIKAVAHVDKQIDDMTYARCLLLIQKATGELELSFSYASHERNQPEWIQGRGHYTYVNMRPETLPALIRKALADDCEGRFDPVKPILRKLAQL
jgi:hypothetical protein